MARRFVTRGSPFVFIGGGDDPSYKEIAEMWRWRKDGSAKFALLFCCFVALCESLAGLLVDLDTAGVQGGGSRRFHLMLPLC